jgi:hypothetical protein
MSTLRKLSALLFAGVVSVATSAFAITGDSVKDFEHPFVGLAVFYDANNQFLWRCSGSMISSAKVLTTGHWADIAS